MRFPLVDDRGQLVPLFGAVVLVALATAFLLVQLGVAANDRARAQAAADAAALAAVAGGPEQAATLAAANDAELLAVQVFGPEATVEVRLGRATARASARRDGPLDPASSVGVDGLHPGLLAALARAEELLGRSVTVTSGVRSRQEQQLLWEQRHENPYPVARPGTSAHERGLAIDVTRADAEALAAVGPRVGLCRPLPERDPIHFELCHPSG